MRSIVSAIATLAVVVIFPSGAAADPSKPVLMQVFLAPSGEPFRAPRGAPYPVVNWFAEADSNGDGKLSKSEFSADFVRFFDKLDVDHDGRLNDPEIRRYERDVAPEVQSGTVQGPRETYQTGDDAKDGPDHESADADSKKPRQNAVNVYRAPAGGASYGLLAIPEPITGMDVNFNGLITRDEVLLAAQRRFRLLDSKNQGFLTLSALPRTQVQEHGGRL